VNFKDIRTALEIFGLGERATLKQIKSRHRSLAKSHHPDHGGQTNPEQIQQVNAAYELLSRYCENYSFSFSEEEFLEQYPEERLKRQFGWDPLWGGSSEDES
jgi:DnaJ-class molecular chaperone